MGDERALGRVRGELVRAIVRGTRVRGSVEARFRVPEPPDYLRADMTVSIDIGVGRKARALTVPSEAVRESGTPSSPVADKEVALVRSPRANWLASTPAPLLSAL